MPRARPWSVATLTDLGRERLSPNFYLRDFLYSEIAQVHGLLNAPDDPELALAAGRRLCEELLEPLQARFGRVVIRSAYRSAEVNALGCARQAEGKAGYSCASNEANAARHIWDRLDADGKMGATACVVLPSVCDRFGHEPDGWRRLAWWIHDHLPYSELEFFPRLWAFNISWHELPKRSIYSRISPRTGYLLRPGADTPEGREAEWQALEDLLPPRHPSASWDLPPRA